MAEEYEVLFDWEPENADDLRLFAGETLEVLQKNEHGWWYGLADRNGTLHKGYFPKNYVKPVVILPDAPKPPPRPTRSMDPPAPAAEPETSKLIETVSKMSVETRGPSFSLKTCQAFDDLMDHGFAVELEDVSKAVAGDVIQKGFHVELSCVAKIWDGASTVTKEFATGTVAFDVGKNQVVSGLDAAVQKLKVSQKATITCSPARAYGAAGNPPSVPPNSFIVFTVEVLKAGPSTADTAGSSSSSGTQMLLGSGIGVRKAKTTENRRDSRIILVSGESGSNTPVEAAATPPHPAASTANAASAGASTAAAAGPGPTPPKPAKPTPTSAPKRSVAEEAGSPDSLALNDIVHDA